jgi:hypothetical protein
MKLALFSEVVKKKAKQGAVLCEFAVEKELMGSEGFEPSAYGL